MIQGIRERAGRPQLYQPSEAPFWEDDHISSQLLMLHFDDSVDAASRPAPVIRATVDKLLRDGLIGSGTRVLDLGCGPGRYAELLAGLGCRVTGIDLSPRSIACARERADEAHLAIEYRVQDFRDLSETGTYDVVLQTFGELSTFSDPVRDSLLGAVRRALVPGGRLVCELSTPAHRRRVAQRHHWSVADGFWRPEPYLLLVDGFAYPDDVWCDQYLVVTETQSTAYRMWFHDYLPETITPVLADAGFVVERLWDVVAGDGYRGGEWLGVVAAAG